MPGEQLRDPDVRPQQRAAGRLGRMRREDELERDRRSRRRRQLVCRHGGEAARTPPASDSRGAAPPRRRRAAGGGGGAARRCSRAGSRARTRAACAPAPRGDSCADRLAHDGRVADLARAAGARADVLLGREERLAFLLDEHPAEQRAEQADVPAQRAVRLVPAQRDRQLVLAGIAHAAILAGRAAPGRWMRRFSVRRRNMLLCGGSLVARVGGPVPS